MYKGNIKFAAQLTDSTIEFQPFSYNPADAGVDKVELQAPDGEQIIASVDVSGIASPDEGCALAHIVVEAALNRLSYFHQVAIGVAKITRKDFKSSQPGIVVEAATLVAEGQKIKLIAGLGANDLKAVLEPPTLAGEKHFEALRSARLSVSATEEFLHLYGILMRLFADKQTAIDAFIVKRDPTVPQTQSLSPFAKQGEMETIYTRLRNELAHKRPAPIDQTKKDMATRVGDLRGIVRDAIKKDP